MPYHRIRFDVSPELDRVLTASVLFPSGIQPTTYTRLLRRVLAVAPRRPRARGVIIAPLLGLQLGVYRTTLFGRRYELITRGRHRPRVVGIVPASSWRPVRRHAWAAEARPFDAAAFAGLQSEVDESGAEPWASGEGELSELEGNLLGLELLGVDTEQDLDQFLGKVFSTVGKIGKGLARGVSKVGAVLGKVVNAVNKVVPVKALWNLGPIGMASRLAKSVGRIAKGENIFKVAGKFVKSGLKDVGQAVQLASTVASFVPGIGTGVSAALGAAGALAQGRPITEALVSAARAALPGGAVAAAAFDVASQLIQGKNIAQAALTAARNQLPGGELAKTAFDAAVALSEGKRLQQVALAAAGKRLPPSPFASSAVQFAQRVARGERLQNATLSGPARAIVKRAVVPSRSAPPRRVQREVSQYLAFAP